jgi:hypothetical protein
VVPEWQRDCKGDAAKWQAMRLASSIAIEDKKAKKPVGSFPPTRRPKKQGK